MKRFIFIALALLFTITAGYANTKLAAKVNGQPIYQSELKYILFQFLSKNKIDPTTIDFNNPQLNNYKNRILKRLIERELILSMAVKETPSDIDQQVETEMNNIIKKYPSKMAFETALINSGTSSEELKSKVRKNIIIDGFMNKLLATIPVSDAEISDFYQKNKASFINEEKVKASHILIQAKNGITPDAAKSKIDSIYSGITSDSSFEELALEYSHCPSAKKGGDLGYFTQTGNMDETFKKVAFGLKVGEISKPFKSQFGYHIIKLYDRKAAETVTLKDASGKIKSMLGNKKMESALEKKLDAVRQKSRIEKFM